MAEVEFQTDKAPDFLSPPSPQMTPQWWKGSKTLSQSENYTDKRDWDYLVQLEIQPQLPPLQASTGGIMRVLMCFSVSLYWKKKKSKVLGIWVITNNHMQENPAIKNNQWLK